MQCRAEVVLTLAAVPVVVPSFLLEILTCQPRLSHPFSYRIYPLVSKHCELFRQLPMVSGGVKAPKTSLSFLSSSFLAFLRSSGVAPIESRRNLSQRTASVTKGPPLRTDLACAASTDPEAGRQKTDLAEADGAPAAAACAPMLGPSAAPKAHQLCAVWPRFRPSSGYF